MPTAEFNIPEIPKPTHHSFIDIEGQIFGRLKVLAYAGKRGTRSHWYCLCECGNCSTPEVSCLRNGTTASCGCLGREHQRAATSTHKMSQTSIWQIWRGVKRRCLDPRVKGYKNYGGRGVKICSRWRESFENFYADMGDRPSRRHSLERRNNDGDYTPENCYWATDIEQHNNTRRSRFLEFQGKKQTITQWARELDINVATLYNRVKRGWNTTRILTAPVVRKYPSTFVQRTST